MHMLANIKVPTLILTGGMDTTSSTESPGKWKAALSAGTFVHAGSLPGSELIIGLLTIVPGGADVLPIAAGPLMLLYGTPGGEHCVLACDEVSG